MRPDMFEVIVERPRQLTVKANGSHYPRGALKSAFQRAPDEAPRLESMGGRYGHKHLNENLAPLRRFLRARVGRPWNRVFAELSAEIDVGSAVQKHVRDHLRDLIHIRTWLGDDGTLLYADHWGRPRPLLPGYRDVLFVDPRDGLLACLPAQGRTAWPWRRPAVEVAEVKVLGPMAEARRLGRDWFRYDFLPLPESRDLWGACFDQLLKVRLTGGQVQELWRTHGRADRYAASKRQLSKREVARLGLVA